MTINTEVLDVNVAAVEMGLVPVDRLAMLPVGVEMRSSRTGKVLGMRQHFTGQMSAKDVKAALKKSNPKLSGKALGERVNEVLRGEKNFRQVVAAAWLQAAFNDGWVPDCGMLRKNTGTLGLVKVAEEKVKEVKAVNLKDKVATMSVEEKQELLKLLGV